MPRNLYTAKTGQALAETILGEARETFPDDLPSQDTYVLAYLKELLKDDQAPNGKPWPAAFWRGLGKALAAS